MQFLGREIEPLGMGCWPIGGPMYSGNEPLGYAGADDAESVRTIHAALANGITLFDTAAAYGAGHAERLLGKALKGRSEAIVVTKIGIAIDEATKQLTGDDVDPANVIPAIDHCLARLARDRVDVVLLHQNGLPVSEAEPIFERMEEARKAGKVGAFGWSTDFAKSVEAVADLEGFAVVEHAMNVLLDAPRMRDAIRKAGLIALIRSPLAMGLLGGRYGPTSVVPSEDIRSTANPKTAYFADARPNPHYLRKLDAARELLMSDGRTLAQGAIGWLWAMGATNLPIPGARTAEQIEGLAGALQFGPLSAGTVTAIESAIEREDEGKEKAR